MSTSGPILPLYISAAPVLDGVYVSRRIGG